MACSSAVFAVRLWPAHVATRPALSGSVQAPYVSRRLTQLSMLRGLAFSTIDPTMATGCSCARTIALAHPAET